MLRAAGKRDERCRVVQLDQAAEHADFKQILTLDDEPVRARAFPMRSVRFIPSMWPASAAPDKGQLAAVAQFASRAGL
jgi:hypothetical protein